LFSHPRNPSQPPFYKGRRIISPFEKGGLRGISGGSWHLGISSFIRLNSYDIFDFCSLPFAFLLFSLFLFGIPGWAKGQSDLLKHPREMSFPPLSFDLPQAERTVLSNGMIVYLLENPELPLIRASALIRTGSIYDPPGQSGLAGVTASVLRNGGTLERNPRAVNEALEKMAAQVEFSMEMESGSASFFVRKQDFPKVLPIFADLLINPGFDADQGTSRKRRGWRPSAGRMTTPRRLPTGNSAKRSTGEIRAAKSLRWSRSRRSSGETSSPSTGNSTTPTL